MSVNNELLPDFFPLSPKPCRSVAELFFACYNLKTIKNNDNDTEDY